MSGQWPPEWEDPDDGHPDAGLPDERHSDDGHSDLELSEVTSFLASVPGPALPASFEARISAAIAAEAAARAASEPRAAAEPVGPLTAAAGAGDAKDTDRSANPEEFSPAATAGGRSTPAAADPAAAHRASGSAAAASRPGGSRPGTGRRRLRMPSMQAASWTLVCVLVLAGFGFLVTRGSGSSTSSRRKLGQPARSRPPRPGATSRSPPRERRRNRLTTLPPAGGRRPDQVPGLLDRHCVQAVNAGQPGAGRVGRPRHRSPTTPANSASATAPPPAPPPPARPPRAHRSPAAPCPRPSFPGACHGHRRRRAQLGGQGQLRRNPGLHHRGADSGVGGGTRLHGGRHAAHRAGAAQGLAGISAP